MIAEDLCCVITPTVPLSDLAGLVCRSNPSEAVIAPRDLNSAQHLSATLRRGSRIYLIVAYMRSGIKPVHLIILFRALGRQNILEILRCIYSMNSRPLMQTSITSVINGEETMSYFKRSIHFGVCDNSGGPVTSERQKAANRANALHSTGPKTREGKVAVRLNAIRHGLLARDAVLPGEDADAFEQLWNEVHAVLSPVGPIEQLLVERVINAMWRLRRSVRAETALFHWRVYWLKATRLRERVRSYERDFLQLAGFSTITDEAAHSEAMEALAEVESERDRDEIRLGCAIDADAREADTFAKLGRYETRLERSLFRILNELPNAGQASKPSVILDVRCSYLERRRYPMTSCLQAGPTGRAQPKRTLINARLVPCPPDRSRNHFLRNKPNRA
jgi:hypothetical protein